MLVRDVPGRLRLHLERPYLKGEPPLWTGDLDDPHCQILWTVGHDQAAGRDRVLRLD
jgi:hypothetical protein